MHQENCSETLSLFLFLLVFVLLLLLLLKDAAKNKNKKKALKKKYYIESRKFIVSEDKGTCFGFVDNWKVVVLNFRKNLLDPRNMSLFYCDLPDMLL